MKFLLYLSIFYYQLHSFSSMNLFTNFNRKSNNIINNKENINFCKDCKYFLPSDIFLIPDNDFAKCALYTQTKEDENYLVTGKIRKDKVEYMYCSLARNNEKRCGQEGKDFVSKFNKP